MSFLNIENKTALKDQIFDLNKKLVKARRTPCEWCSNTTYELEGLTHQLELSNNLIEALEANIEDYKRIIKNLETELKQ